MVVGLVDEEDEVNGFSTKQRRKRRANEEEALDATPSRAKRGATSVSRC